SYRTPSRTYTRLSPYTTLFRSVIQLNLEEGLALFDDHSFDVVLQLDTLQHLRNTEKMLRETARVGRIGVVSFPNFAHWPNRLHVDRKSTRLNSSHVSISYAVFC